MIQRKEMTFVIFLIHALAKAWNKIPAEVYAILNDTLIIDEYVVPSYDALHTLGEQYLIQDITEFVQEKGIIL